VNEIEKEMELLKSKFNTLPFERDILKQQHLAPRPEIPQLLATFQTPAFQMPPLTFSVLPPAIPHKQPNVGFQVPPRQTGVLQTHQYQPILQEPSQLRQWEQECQHRQQQFNQQAQVWLEVEDD
jgi:hypothetical protein